MIRPTPVDTTFSLLDLLPTGVFVLRADFTIRFWNSCMVTWTGISTGQAEGAHILELFPSLKNPAVLSRISQIFDGGPAVIFSPLFHPHLIPCATMDGTLRVLKISCIPMTGISARDDSGILVLVVIDDVTDLTHLVNAYREKKGVAERQLEELTKAQDALCKANNKLSVLASITRHDILNQLMGLRAYLELSKEDVKDPVVQEYIKKEEQAAEAIEWQIKFARNYQDIGMQAPKWHVLSETINAAIRDFQVPGVEVTVAVDGVEVFAEPLLEKVFVTLVENSFRHGDHVTRMGFSVKETADGLLLTYCDNGVGITLEDKKNLFKKGFGKHTGLGLFLLKEILSITDITITEAGEPGKGVRFVMTVPKGAYRFGTTDVPQTDELHPGNH
ncbi:MAG: PAS domain-containing sensor histidine kinase [Methanoregula sp.]|jgi:signal transduction histidine kinase|nr:PAS domain-containing sensor histidine kinase [Methanoregula sp.]MDD5023722.1 PAS domain-containing sensor histidine kinase [Methanoregula sp.]MDD5187989.1 PAS domain-containing sensor histidine kinase [Methanoregula sp.]